ncbi:Ras-related protein Rab-13 [Hondaea fermentalgiana]|uniref:Ras-related protein Rab-13 n=1 Tax=Hondaea fermentalgiana TaxID=2315210 RepID=A0A2R5G478_9STRA|nr:Ras-related protein Rab-13 [Hondaea fermentalgiana]|eukprot:GBG25800.1 Ras-related protein Rab-13 [Hondaea fermentalgiana]
MTVSEGQGQVRTVHVPDIVRIKVTSMGDGGVGKSCLIKRYCEERFVSKYITTVGVDYGVKTVDVEGYEVRVNFWDLSGHGEFFDVRNEFYKDTQGAILCFDLSSRRSFEALDGWLTEARKYGCSETSAQFVLVGCKSDKRRIVTEHEAQSWARERGIPYWETSSNTGANVVEMFESLFQRVVRRFVQ